DDRDSVVAHQVEEPGEDVSDGGKQPLPGGECEHHAPPRCASASYGWEANGAGSSPPAPNGWHRRILHAARALPTSAPPALIASSAYMEHDGWKRHCPPKRPDSVAR